jgi:hypothetical protein
MTDTSSLERALTAPKRIPGTPNADAEPPTVARSGNNLFILWHEFPPGFDPGNAQPDIFLARSKDGGTTFQPRINLSDSRTVFSGGEKIAVSGSRVYVVWVEGDAVVFRRDKENDGVFANRITLSNAATAINLVPESLRIVASGNNVFVAWQADAAAGRPPDIFFTRSTNAGDTFQGPVNVSANVEESSGPAMTLISDNRVLIAWRDFSAGAAAGAEIFYVLGP